MRSKTLQIPFPQRSKEECVKSFALKERSSSFMSKGTITRTQTHCELTNKGMSWGQRVQSKERPRVEDVKPLNFILYLFWLILL